MGLLNNMLGTGNVIEKGMDLIDKRFSTEVDMIEGADDILQKSMARTHRINKIVGAEYLPRRNGVLS